MTMDRRFLAPLLITVILVVGQMTAGFLESGYTTFLAIATAIAVEALLGRAFTGRWPHLASAYVSGISVGILVRSPEIWPYAVCSALAISSKYLLRIDGRHVWNPSNFAIVAMLLLAPDVVASLSVQWGNQLWAMVPVWCVGAAVLYSLGRLHITATYVAAFIVLAFARTWFTGDPFLAEAAPITGPMYQLFACFMVTDPKTTVRTRSGQIAVVTTVAVCEAVLRLAEVVHAPYYALFLVGPTALVFEIMKDRVRRVAPGAVVAIAGVIALQACGYSGSPSADPAAAVPTDQTGGMRFTETAEASGLDFTHVSGASGRFYFVEQWGSGAAFLDFDQDGWIDLFLAQGGALPGYGGPPAGGSRLYRNRGAGAFTDVTASSGLSAAPYTLGVATADYDNDGDPDLFLTTVSGAVLYENSGSGRFKDVTAAAGIRVGPLATSAAFIDYDADGRLDLFVARYQDYALATDRACVPQATFPPVRHLLEYCGPGRPAVRNLLFRNEGGGRFREVSRQTGIGAATARALGVIAADLNGDGRTDLFVASDRSPNLLFLNLGGRFTETAAAAGVAVGKEGIAYAGMGVDAADYDNDGWLDLVITNYEHEPVTLYRNQGNGLFTDESERVGLTPLVFKFMKWGTRLVDFDLDGRKDLLIANGHLFPHLEEGTPLGLPIAQTRKGHAQEAQVFQQRADGQFVERSATAGPFFSERRVFRGAAVADVDNDGDWDAVLTAIDSPVALLRNEGRGRTWAGLRLVGVVSNRDAIGAIVTVRTAAATQTFGVNSGGSYLSDHDRRVIVGLEGSTLAAAEIRWPCGSTTRVNLAPGVITTARESGCTVK